MVRENRKLVSLRLEPEVLEAIDEFHKKHRYWKRSGIMNDILHSVFKHFSDADIYDMICATFPNNGKVEAKFSIERNKKPQAI